MKMEKSDLSTLPIGDIEFFDHMIPALEDGDYVFNITPEISGDDAIDSSSLQTKVQHFSVQGPRFSLNMDQDVQSIYPPPNSAGQFEYKLPNIVLTKRTMPWERQLKPQGTALKGTPWVALLLLDEDQIQPPKTTNTKNPTLAATLPLSEVRNLNANGILGPAISKLEYGQSDAMTCEAIDISTDTFQAVMPRIEELPFLSHAREVSVGDKPIMNIGHSGWFSVVVSNRLPVKAPTEKTKQICHLVSLEGFEDYLDESPSFPAGTHTIRLVSLTSWTFTCLPEKGESFSGLMLNLVSPESELNTDLLFKLPPPSITSQDKNHILVSDAINSGFVPMDYQVRTGDKTFSWYRGPFSPVLTELFTEKMGPFESPEQAAIYDQNTGLFNLSYATAFQTGKLLALRSQTFSTNLLKWRRELNRIIDLLVTRLKSDSLCSLIQSQKDKDHYNDKNIAGLHNWLSEQLVSKTYLDYLLENFSEEIAPKIPSVASPDFSGTSQTPSTFNPSFTPDTTPSSLSPDLVKELKKLLEQDEVQALLKEAATVETAALIDWLGELYLLYGVPANTLIPNSDLLPRESLRFFYLDRAWLDCLIDGAMSIGVHTSKDSLYYKITKGIILDQTRALVMETREKLLGLPPSATDPTEGHMSGLLLRSAAAQYWPGLEVRAYNTVTQTADGPKPSNPIKLLRMDRLSPSVLLCLFPSVPAWVEINEPKEGLCFGVEEVTDGKTEEKIGLRHIETGELTGNVYTVSPETDYRTGSDSRVFNIGALKENLAKQPAMPTPFTSADFALQMVVVPEQMVFQNMEQGRKQ